MGTLKKLYNLLWISLVVVAVATPLRADSSTIAAFKLPPIPSPGSQNILPQESVDLEDSSVPNPDIAFVPIDQAIIKSHPNFNGVVLVAKDSQIIFEHSYDPDKKEQQYSEDDVNRQFLLGSMTKQFTAALMLKLVDRKILSLDDSIQKFFPDTPKSWANIKIRHLLNHTSGFTYEYLSFKRPCPFQNQEQGLAILKKKNPHFAPGQTFRYRNMNYFLLGSIIEEVTGQKLPNVLETEITGPLSMERSGMIGASAVGTGFNASQPACYFAVGNMYSSPRDLFKWEHALFSEKSVLSEETLEQMTKPEISTYHYYTTITTDKNKRTITVPDYYGLGLRISDVSGQRIYWHSGHISNYTSLFYYLKDKEAVVVVLSKTTNEHVFNIANDIVNSVFNLPTVPVPVDSHKETSVASKLTHARRTKLAKKPYSA